MVNDITWNINISPGRRTSPLKAEPIVGAAVDNVGFFAATNRQRALMRNLRRDFEPIVERQLIKMARDVSRMAIGTNGSLTAPKGTLKINGQVADAMRGQSGSMSISSMTGNWKARNKQYMRYKFRTYRTRKWFRNTGKLERQLANIGTYRSAYGPIRMSFKPKSLRNQAGNASTLGRSRGGQSRNIQIGRLEIEPLRRLRASDLTPIGAVATYKPGLMMPLADSVEKKLTGRPSDGFYRPVLEPFLTYYLTRKIPNAIFRKIESSLI